MDASFHDHVDLFSPDEVRDIVTTAYEDAKSRLERRRREKILGNLRKAASCEKPSSKACELSRGAMLAMESLSNLGPCSTTMQRINRAPNGLAWVRVSTNLKAPDNYKDKFFVPYLGESDAQQNFSNAIAADADLCLAEQYAEDDISDAENTVKVTPVEGLDYSPGKQLRSNKRGSQKNRENHAVTTRHGRPRIQKSSEIMWARAAKRVALEQLVLKLRIEDTRSVAGVVREIFGMPSFAEIESCHKNVIYRRQAYKESDDEALLRHGQRTELLEQLKGKTRVRSGNALRGDSLPFFFCRQCYIYNCLEHGTQTAKPAKQPPDRTKKETATRQGAEGIESRCSDKGLSQCWCISQSTGDTTEWWLRAEKNETYSDNLKSVVLELFASFGKDPCRISELARIFIADHKDDRLTCRRVGYLLETLVETSLKDNQCRQSARRAKRKYRTKAPRGETEGMKGGQRVDYAPCQHEGPCTAKSCRCVENGVNCEKYCACNHTRIHRIRPDKRLPCNHAFQGCTCRSAVACMSNACVCYSYGRECDPDLCRACHDCRDSTRARSCRNVGLLMGERQRTVVGRSETHGWGAFATTDIGKGEIIGEYVGEVVSHVDADRRGMLYDEIDYSFLFNITEDWALDSTRLGNKLRYCNHHFKPNCAAKLMRVGGDVRVGLYAVRDIGKHEELFFDYKYKNGPVWSMPGAEGKKGSSRGQKQDESVKKRAPAFGDNEEEDEVIPIPKKRARQEKRERSPLRPVRDGVRYTKMGGVDDSNLDTRRAILPNEKNPSDAKSASRHGDIASAGGMARKGLTSIPTKSGYNSSKDMAEGSTAEKHEMKRSGDTREVVCGVIEEIRSGSSEWPPFNGRTPHGSRSPSSQRRRETFVRGFRTSRSQSQLKNAPSDSRANNVTDANSLDTGVSNLPTYRRRHSNALNHERTSASSRPVGEKQRSAEPSALRDVFGSDLESLDDDVNPARRNLGPRQAADLLRNRRVSGASLRPSRSASAPARSGLSSDSSSDSREAQRLPPGRAKSATTKQAKGKKLAGIAKGPTRQRAKVISGITALAQCQGKVQGHALSTAVTKGPCISKSARTPEMRNTNDNRSKERTSLPRRTTRDSDANTERGSASMDDGHAPQLPGTASPVVPHINLISDDDQNPHDDSCAGAFSNSSNDSAMG